MINVINGGQSMESMGPDSFEQLAPQSDRPVAQAAKGGANKSGAYRKLTNINRV